MDKEQLNLHHRCTSVVIADGLCRPIAGVI